MSSIDVSSVDSGVLDVNVLEANVNAGVKSPCVSVCKLDESKICIGCWRSLEEIRQWSKMNDQQKTTVLEMAAKRKYAEPTN